jgi:ribosome-binding factor A
MKKKGFQRSDRVAEQVRRDLADLIRRDLKDPRVGMISLTAVELTPDYAHAKVFYATLVVDGTEISARPSDGIALALRTASPILVHEDVFASAGITMAPEEDDEVERFREFLDQVSPEDFVAPADEPADPDEDFTDKD